jgi:hypothetical protein
MMEVTDKYGKRVTRPNGVLQDGDRLTVKMTMMDASNPALAHAAAVADAIRRAEAFDAGHHPQAARYGKTDAASHTAREARDAKMRDAWKNPPSVTKGDATAIEQVAIVGPSAPVEQLQAARDQVVANRDKRLEAAWR